MKRQCNRNNMAQTINTDTGVKITGDIDMGFDRMAREMPAIQKKALNVGARELVEKIRQVFVDKMPTAAQPVRQQTGNNGYKITSQEPLVEAVRQTKYENGKVKVHGLGSGQSGSSTFIARFYENVTKVRYNKTYKGQKLKKKRNTGVVGGVRYFNPTVQSYMPSVISTISGVIYNKLSGLWESAK